jgi:hypothetical protein
MKKDDLSGEIFRCRSCKKVLPVIHLTEKNLPAIYCKECNELWAVAVIK